MVTAVAYIAGVIGNPNPGNPTGPWVFAYTAKTTASAVSVEDQVPFDPNATAHRLRADVEQGIKDDLVAAGLMSATDDVWVVGL